MRFYCYVHFCYCDANSRPSDTNFHMLSGENPAMSPLQIKKLKNYKGFITLHMHIPRLHFIFYLVLCKTAF